MHFTKKRVSFVANDGAIRGIRFEPGLGVTKNGFRKGVKAYAKIAEALGMDSDDHSRFLVYTGDPNSKTLERVGSFVYYDVGGNCAEEMIAIMHKNPDIEVLGFTKPGEVKHHWAGGTWLPSHKSWEKIGLLKSAQRLYLVNSGAPEWLDVVLVCAFAWGLNRKMPDWGLEIIKRAPSYYTKAMKAASALLARPGHKASIDWSGIKNSQELGK